MGFGFSGMLLGSTVSSLIKGIGWRETFLLLGVAFGIIVFIGSRVLKLPPSDYIFPSVTSRSRGADSLTIEITGG